LGPTREGYRRVLRRGVILLSIPEDARKTKEEWKVFVAPAPASASAGKLGIGWTYRKIHAKKGVGYGDGR